LDGRASRSKALAVVLFLLKQKQLHAWFCLSKTMQSVAFSAMLSCFCLSLLFLLKQKQSQHLLKQKQSQHLLKQNHASKQAGKQKQEIKRLFLLKLAVVFA
jgi:hypothetical protein